MLFATQRSFRAAFFFLLLASSRCLYADVGLLLHESVNEGISEWTNAGHAAIYFSSICPASPVEMRLCEPGEQGSVLSNYTDFDESQPYEWNVVPLNVFLYGVEDEKDRPLYASLALREALQERYRKRYLTELCSGPPCTTNLRANWRDMVAATFARDIYLFKVKTTLEQDVALIEKFNARPNVNRFNSFTRNCADFASEVINTYFPRAVRMDHVNDFGMTSPKAIAKSFTHYAQKRPALRLQVIRFSQIPGEFKPSRDCRKGTEVIFRSKRWLFPMLVRSNELVLFATSYFATGRFNPERELRRRPTEDVSIIQQESKTARSLGNSALVKQLEASMMQERSEMIGTAEEWRTASNAFAELTGEAIDHGLMEKALPGSFLRDLGAQTAVVLDESGAAWLEWTDQVIRRKLGLSASNVNAPESDPRLAYLVLLARVDRVLRSSSKNREMMPQFKADWQLLERARAELGWSGTLPSKIAWNAMSGRSGE